MAVSHDDQLIDVCRRLLAIHHAQEALVERDPDAPDRGPNHGRHEALSEKFAALGAELTEAAPPTTPEGIQALAQLAMLFPVRTQEGTLQRTTDFADWVRLFALTSAAGRPETIPLPRHLPRYWPRGARHRQAASVTA